MPGRPLLVVGESLVDLIEERSGGDRAYRPRYGGSPLNVAVGAARLGATVQFVTALGADTFGRQISDFLKSENVAVVDDVDPSRRTCLALGTANEGSVRYEYFGDPSSMTDIRVLPEDLCTEAAVLHAGSTALLPSAAREAVLDALPHTRAFKTVDPNPRPSLIDDISEYRAALDRILVMADLVKLSAEDVEYLYPHQTAHQVAKSLIEGGRTAVIVTAASEPVHVFTREGHDLVAVPVIETVDPTGAGDSFMASLLADITADGVPKDLQNWCRLAGAAATAAAFTCASTGGASAMPRLRDLARSN